MDVVEEALPRSPLVALLGALVALGVLRAGLRLWGLLVLAAVVAGTVAVLVIGILVLRIALGV